MRRAAAWLFGPAAAFSLLALAGLAATSLDAAAWADVPVRARASAEVIGSDGCVSCHPHEHASWQATWHRTMTQSVGDDGAVLAPFAGETLAYLGFVATMDRGTDGRPRVTVRDANGDTIFASRVELTVGSHRYQQYIGRADARSMVGELDRKAIDELVRLPVAWHRGEARWIPMNAAFVEPDGEPGIAADYLRHVTRWNDNCLFCHNTEAAPGQDGSQFQSRVGEFGIACEACHGRAGEHVVRHRNPLRRMLAVGRSRADASIALPAKLAPREESAVCGRCHGQRLGRDMAEILRDGDAFVPGTDLASVSRPVFRDTRVGGVGEPVFESRFWPDGTPRLSAHEYQGLLLSPCYQDGKAGGLGCNHCHDMHGDEPDMQVRRGRTGEGACIDCHARTQLGDDHGGHRGVQGVDCLSCHMPRIVYGLLEGMISHRISSPDPGALVGEDGMPDACTSCHVDETRAWAAAAMPSLGLRGTPALEGAESSPRVHLDLVGGDPLQRNLAAHALARPHATSDWRARAGLLVYALDDEYASVRWFARQGLRELIERDADADARETTLALVEAFDYVGAPEARAPIVALLARRFGPGPLADNPELREELERARDQKAIWIGE